MLKNHRYLTIILGFVFILLFSSLGYADLVFESEIPAVSIGDIVVDGYSSDWEILGIQPFLLDDEGDSTCDPIVGTDIKEVYIAQDGEFLYWRLDTVSGTYALDFRDGIHQAAPYFNLNQTQDYEGIGYNWCTSQWIMVGDPFSGSTHECCCEGEDHAPVEYASGDEFGEIKDIAEGKIPLDLYNNRIIDYLAFMYFSGIANVACDWVERSYAPPSPQPDRYFFHWFDVSTRTVDGGDPTTYFWFTVGDNENFGRSPVKNIVKSAIITFPDSTQLQFNPDFNVWVYSEIRINDNNRNGIFEFDQGELDPRLNSGAEYEIISPVSPHVAGDYTLQVTLENDDVISYTKENVPGGLTAVEWPPVTNLNASIDAQTGNITISWDLSTTYPDDPSIEIRIYSYDSNGVERYLQTRVKKLPLTINSFTFPNGRLADIFNEIGAKYFKLQARVVSAGGVNVSRTAFKEYAIEKLNGVYTLTPDTIPEPCSTMYTQEEVEEAIANTCPGNSEYHGKPESPGKSDPPGQNKK